MPDGLKPIYWDACVFLSYVNGTPDRLPHLDSFLELSGSKIQIITSTLSIVEVSFGKMEQDRKVLDDDIEKNINNLWAKNSPIKLLEFYPKIAERAKGLIRYSITQEWKLKPCDAIHLSTAQLHDAEEFHTYDKNLEKFSEYTKMKICEPISDTPRLPFPPDAPEDKS